MSPEGGSAVMCRLFDAVFDAATTPGMKDNPGGDFFSLPYLVQ